MKKVLIKNNGVITHSSEKQTTELANAWVESVAATGAFGQDYIVEIIDTSSELLTQNESNEAKQYLASTDWKILRHLRQKSLNLPLSLTELEYLDLENSRHAAAVKVIHE